MVAEAAAWSLLLVGGLSGLFHVARTARRRPATKVMHTFFEPLASEDPVSVRAARDTLSAWVHNWRRAGWHVRVLSTFEAEHWPFYSELHARFGQNSQFEAHCYLPYAAMAAVGGGWLSDYDVVPISSPQGPLPNTGKLTMHHGQIPALVSGSREEFERLVRRMSQLFLGQKHVPKRVALEKPPDSRQSCSDLFAAIRDLEARGEVMTTDMVMSAELFRSSHGWDWECPEVEQGNHSMAVHFSAAAVKDLGYKLDARGHLINRTMDRWWACHKSTDIAA